MKVLRKDSVPLPWLRVSWPMTPMSGTGLRLILPAAYLHICEKKRGGGHGRIRGLTSHWDGGVWPLWSQPLLENKGQLSELGAQTWTFSREGARASERAREKRLYCSTPAQSASCVPQRRTLLRLSWEIDGSLDMETPSSADGCVDVKAVGVDGAPEAERCSVVVAQTFKRIFSELSQEMVHAFNCRKSNGALIPPVSFLLRRHSVNFWPRSLRNFTKPILETFFFLTKNKLLTYIRLFPSASITSSLLDHQSRSSEIHFANVFCS